MKSSFADRVFYCNSGTEANEAAIKFARKTVLERHAAGMYVGGPLNKLLPPPSNIVAFSKGFHGRTLGK